MAPPCEPLRPTTKLALSFPPGLRTQALASRLAVSMGEAWRAGRFQPVEAYLGLHPEVAESGRAVMRLICEEMCLREEAGQTVPSEEWLERFPRWRSELALLLDCRRVLRGDLDTSLPKIENVLQGFQVLAELGRGAEGRVFLAAETSLAGRLLVVKLTLRDGQEHLSLARLQHTHIVPLYWVRDEPEHNLRLLCMPYLGPATLARVLATLAEQPLAARSGRQVMAALDQAQAGMPISLPSQGPGRDFLTRASYAEAIAWIGACLAEALQYAHDRGLVHLDLKPSNVLVAADGQPLLLDFHLAQPPVRPDEPIPAWFGGTPLYMSPEQEAACRAMADSQPPPAAVDGRSDIYSLGLVLYEALAGSLPPRQGPLPALSARKPTVATGLMDIIHKCLAADPKARYASAAALADDLRRQLADRPLRGVANRSVVERWRKWRRRKPQALAVAVLALALLAGTLYLGFGVVGRAQQRHLQAESALRAGQEQLRARRFTDAVRSFERGKELAAGLLGHRQLAATLTDHWLLAKRAQAAHDLRQRADLYRFLSLSQLAPARSLQVAEALCQETWQTRLPLLRHPGPKLEAGLEQAIQDDLLDLAIGRGEIGVRLAKEEEKPEAHEHALRLLAEAEARFGPSLVLCRERQAHAEALGHTARAEAAARQAAALKPRNAWEQYALGRLWLRLDQPETARQVLEQAIQLEPHAFWPNYCLGVCAVRLGRFGEAVTAFSVCIGQAPGNAEAFHQRGLAYQAQGDADRALADLDRALQIQPEFVTAYVSRGLLHARQGRHAAAALDLEQALAGGASSDQDEVRKLMRQCK